MTPIQISFIEIILDAASSVGTAHSMLQPIENEVDYGVDTTDECEPTSNRILQ